MNIKSSPSVRLSKILMRTGAIAGSLLTLCSNAYALRSEVSVGAGLEYSDNVRLVETGEQNETTRIALFGFALTEQSSAIKMNVRSLTEYRNYQNGVFKDELLFNLNGDLNVTLIPNRFEWVVRDYFRQGAPNRRLPDTPSNRINVNTFSTGPDLKFRFGSVDSILASARYSDHYFEDNLSDSERQLVSIKWMHQLINRGVVSATISAQNVDFTESVANDDFTRNEIYASYITTQGHNEIQLDIGSTIIDRDVGKDINGFLGRLNWIRQLGENAAFELAAYAQYTDSGLNLLNAGSATTLTTTLGNEQLSTGLFYDESLKATYRRGRMGNSYAIGTFLRKEDYETLTTLDRGSYGVLLNGERALMARVIGNAHASYTQYDFDVSNETQKVLEVGAGIDYRLSRHLNMTFDITRRSRDSNIAGFDYDENRALLTLYYGADPYSYKQ